MTRIKPYYRVSRHDARRGITIEIQQSVCKQAIERRAAQGEPVELLEPAIDLGRSAFSEDWTKRIAFVRLLEEAKTGTFDEVIVYMIDRFSRHTAAGLRAIAKLLDSGVQVRSATEHIDYSTPSGRKNLRDSLSSAEYYSDLLSQRMRDVRQLEVVTLGRHVGPIPIGYDRVDGILIPNQYAAAYRFAVDLHLTGMHGAGTITQRLNQAGYTMPSGKLFKKTGVEEMLKNPVYGGFVSLKGERFAGKHEPLIDLATWERVEEINSERSRRRVKTSTQRHPLLAGLGVCTLCGAPLWHQTYTETGRRYYYCSTKVHHGEGPHPGLVCTGHKMSAEKIEHALLGWIGGLALTPGLLEDARQILATTPVSPKVDMVKVRERLKRLGQAYADDAFSEAEYTERKQVLLDQLAAPLSSLPPVDNTAVLGLLNDLPALFRDATPDERRALIGELVSEIYVGHSEIYALRPTKAAEALFLAAEQRPDWRAIDTEVLTSGNLVGRVGFHGAPRTRTAH